MSSGLVTKTSRFLRSRQLAPIIREVAGCLGAMPILDRPHESDHELRISSPLSQRARLTAPAIATPIHPSRPDRSHAAVTGLPQDRWA